MNFWKSNYAFMEGFDNLPPWFWEPNSTCWWQVAIIYMITIAIGARYIVEIGVDQGYGAWTLAHAAKKNSGEYVGIDIVNVWDRPFEGAGVQMSRYFEGHRLPVRFIQGDSKLMTEIPIERIDLAFVDGEHTYDAVHHEVNQLIYPKCQKNGTAYICLHDIVDFPGVKQAWEEFKVDPRFECIEFYNNYGLGIMRVKKSDI